MSISTLQSAAGIRLLAILATFMLAESGACDEFPFRVAYERVPGAEQVEAGDIGSGIEILQQALDGAAAEMHGRILATLCAAYTAASAFEEAGPVCNEAVAETGSAIAYNNRGVYRVLTGNWHGARADFARARPEEMERYLEQLKQRDIGLVATGNFELMESLQDKYTPAVVGHFQGGAVDVELFAD